MTMKKSLAIPLRKGVGLVSSVALVLSLTPAAAFAASGGDGNLVAGTLQAQSDGAVADRIVQAVEVEVPENITLFDSYADDDFDDDPDLSRYTNKDTDGTEYAATEHDDGHIYYAPVKLVKYDDDGVVYYFTLRSDRANAADLVLIDDAPALVKEDGSIDTTKMLDINIPAGVTVDGTTYDVVSIDADKGTKFVGTYDGVSYNNYDKGNTNLNDGENGASKYLFGTYFDTTARQKYWDWAKSEAGGSNQWTPAKYYFGGMAGGVNIMDESYKIGEMGDNDGANTKVFSKQVNSVHIPATVESTGYRAFWGFTSTKVTFGEGSKLNRLAERTFEDNAQLADIVLPEGLKTLGSLTYKTYSISRSSDESSAYTYNESGLVGRYVAGSLVNNAYPASQIVGKDRRELAEAGGKPIFNGYVFFNNAALTKLDLPSSLEAIGALCFSGSGITEIAIPKFITSSGVSTFLSGMSSLEKVSISEGNTELSEYDGVIYTSDGSKELYYPENKVVLNGTPSGYSEFAMNNNSSPNSKLFGTTSSSGYGAQKITNVKLGDAVKTIRAGEFQNNKHIESFEFSESLESVGSQLFQGCANLKEVVFPVNGNLKVLSNNLFYNCSSLSSIAIPDYVETLDRYVFMNCASLKSVSLGKNCKSIGGGCFRGAAGLKTIVVNSEVDTLELANYEYTNASTGAKTDYPALSTTANKALDNASMYFAGNVNSINDVDGKNSSSELFFTKNLSVYSYSPSVKEFFTGESFKAKSASVGNPDVVVSYTDLNTNLVKIGAGPASATLSAIDAQDYTGKAIEPAVAVTYGSGDDAVTLEADKDYTVAYANNMQPGTATVTVQGMGDYLGTVSADFTINANEQSDADAAALDSVEASIAALPAEVTAENVDAVAAVADAYAALSDAAKSQLTAGQLAALVDAQSQVATVKQAAAEQALAAAEEEAAKNKQAADEAQKAADVAKQDADKAKQQAADLQKDLTAAQTAKANAEQAAKDAKAAQAKAEGEAKTAKAAQAKAAAAAKSSLKKNTMTVKAKTVKAKANKKTTAKKAKAFKVTGAKGKVTFYKVSGNAKITVSKAGKVTVKKGLKKGKTYKVKVLVSAAGNKSYAPAFKTVTLKVKVTK